jgi:hypothetical protein
MIRYIDHKFPGPNGLQIRHDPPTSSPSEDGAGEALYFPNYRTDRDLSPGERAALYAKRLQEFKSEGGSLDEVKVMDEAFARRLLEYSRFEYVWTKAGKVRLTEGKAGHILLAEGKPVQGAGQIVLLRNSGGEFTMLIVSNASGSFKPDLLSAERLSRKLAYELRIPTSMVLVTKGEPMSSQATKIYLKAEGTDPAVIKARTQDLEARGRALMAPKTSSPGCGEVFSAA